MTLLENVTYLLRDVHRIQYKFFSGLTFVGVSVDKGSTRGIKDLYFVKKQDQCWFSYSGWK